MNHLPDGPRSAPTPGLAVSPYVRLAALGAAPDAGLGRWYAWVLGLGCSGRLTLPASARGVAGVSADGRPSVRAESRGDVLVLRAEGVGRPTRLDERGRLYLPGWLRRRSGGTVLVAARRPEPTVVVVVPSDVIDGAIDALAGEVG